MRPNRCFDPWLRLAAVVAGVLVAAILPISVAASGPSGNCAFAAQAVPVEGGTIRFVHTGSGPTVLLLHGLFANKEQWQGVACRLAASGSTVITPDLPGYGQSAGFPLSAYRLESQVALLDQFVTALGLGRIDIAGNSMGGAIAALYARAWPQRVRSLAFIGAPLGITGWSHDVRLAIEDGVNPFIPTSAPELDLELGLLFVRPPTLPDEVRNALLREYNERLRHYTQVWNIVVLDIDVLRHDRRPWPIPTLALWGTVDRIFSIGGAGPLRARLAPRAFLPLAGAGHLPQVEDPDRVVAAYGPFLTRARATVAGSSANAPGDAPVGATIGVPGVAVPR